MKIAADTNVLLRAAVRDDPQQAISAAKVLRSADLLAVPVAALCEFAWVMRSAYKRSAQDVAVSIRSLVTSPNVVTNQPAVDAGLEVLEKGGDFADGVIAYEGHWLGAEEFVSFDKQAVSLLKSQGKRARLLS
ncbi:MAG: type II toxin-antitoxin system VapC family toxin [Terracidiphilus sp.]|jgi:predicted nucleic-acid-binding protein